MDGTLILGDEVTFSGTGGIGASISGAGTVDLGGGTRSFTVNDSGATTDLLISAIVANGQLTKAGAGTLQLSSTSSTYAGPTTITGGVLSISANTNLGATPASATPGNVVINGGTLQATAGFTLSTNRGIAVGPTTGSGTGTIDVTTGTLTYGGILANNTGGTGGLNKSGAGTLTLSGSAANTYTGATSVAHGTLALNKSGTATAVPGNLAIGDASGAADSAVVQLGGASTNQIANTSDVTIASDGRLNLNGVSETIDGLDGSGSITNAVAGSFTLTVGSNNQVASDFSGSITNSAGTVALTKTGSGKQTLSGTNGYTGATTINGGTLLVNGSTASGSAVAVNSTGTLGGTGIVNGPVTTAAGGTVSPGLSPGVLNDGNTTLVDNSTFLVEIAGGGGAGNANGHDQLNVTGTVAINGATLSLDFTGLTAGELSLGQTFVILKNDNTDLVTGSLFQDAANNPLAEGAVVATNVAGSGLNLKITYVHNADSGSVPNDVALFVPFSLSATLSGGNLTIADTDATKNNSLTVKRVNISGTDYLEFTEANEQFASAPSTTPPSTLTGGNKTLTIPLSAIPGSFTFNGAGGNDTFDRRSVGRQRFPRRKHHLQWRRNERRRRQPRDHRRQPGNGHLWLQQYHQRRWQRRDERLWHDQLYRPRADHQHRHRDRHHLQPARRPQHGHARR